MNNQQIQQIFIAAVMGYAFGCIQAAYIIGRLIKKEDIRRRGSNNAGASNATIVWGWKYGVIVALIDILKAIIAVLLIKYIYMGSGDVNSLMYITGAFVVIGHNYPFFMKFKGGKGTASLIGMLIAIDWRMALAGILLIVLGTIFTDYITIGTIAMMVSFCICTALFDYGLVPIIISVALSLLSIYNHIPNIRRIVKHEETGLRSTFKKKE